jgi:hypothetical protein
MTGDRLVDDDRIRRPDVCARGGFREEGSAKANERLPEAE